MTSSHTYYDHKSLDAFLCELVNKEIEKPSTGVFYDVSLPSNFTGMQVSVVRLRSISLWSRGMNYSFSDLPPRMVPQPNEERLAILYENLGNWSSLYFNVPKHTMVAPVLGLTAYSSTISAFVDEKIQFIIKHDPIRIRFPSVEQQGKNNTPICARFSADGLVHFNDMTEPYVCEAYSQGHYTLVVPSLPSPHTHSKRFSTWWVFGFVIGFVGLVILALVLLALIKEAKKRRIKKMEKNSSGGEPFDTFWIGETKLPLASMIRTQPTLESGDAIR
ncbi:hypothetical protein CR513_09318, partial [Mucuna pruriens]